MEIAVFGGSFDPIHNGHVNIVKKAVETLNIDKLIIVPTYLNPFKNSFHYSPKIRLDFIQKVFSSYQNIKISSYEISRNKPIYTIDTIKYLKKIYKTSKIYFIIGWDNLENLHKWKNIDELESLVEFVIATRNDYKYLANNKKYRTLEVNIDISSSKLRKNIDLKYIPNEIKNDILNLNQNKGNKLLENRLEKIRHILDEKKAEDIEVIDLTSKDYIVDYVIIATTLNSKHGFALLNHLKNDLKPLGEEFIRVEEDDNWTICDLGDVFIHLMSESHREKYSIEEFLNQLETKA